MMKKVMRKVTCISVYVVGTTLLIISAPIKMVLTLVYDIYYLFKTGKLMFGFRKY